MRTVTFYDPRTGEIAGFVQGGDFEIEQNCPPGHEAIEGRHDATTHRIVDGRPVAKPSTSPPSPDYRARRHAAYPSLNEFADALYWRERGDDTKWRAWLEACDAVKADHPKGT